MSKRRTKKIWIGVGTAALLGSGAAGAIAHDGDGQRAAASAPRPATQLAQGHGAHQPAEAKSAKQGGEGGEGGEGDASGLEPRVKFLRDLGLIRGHLLVGDELVKEGRWEDALPHFHHPVEELYAGVAPTLKKHNMRAFDGALKALAQTVQAKKADAYAAALKVVDERITAVEQAMRRFASPYPVFMMRTAVAILRSAGGEYEEAIENGRIANVVEYQDGRGFVLEAEKIINTFAKDLENKNKEALTNVRSTLAELKKTWPTLTPPSPPVKDHAAVVGDISRVEIAAGPLLGN